MANADSSLAEYSQSQLDNLDAHIKTHDYEVICAFKYDPKQNQITPFNEITNQILNKSEAPPKLPSPEKLPRRPAAMLAKRAIDLPKVKICHEGP